MAITNHWQPDQIGDLSGQTALVTGATSGIGWQTSRVLAQHGARVILTGRDQTGLSRAIQSLQDEFPDAQLVPLVLDLASLDSIRIAAAQIAAAETIELLFNNAGVMNLPRRTETKDGFETTFGTNHLGHFAFNALIWPAIRRAGSARIVTVSAIAATWSSGRLVDLMSQTGYRPMTAYAKSKRANLVYTLELARRTQAQHLAVTPVVVHPGSALTNLQRHSAGGLEKALMPLARRLLMGSPEGAAWPSLYAATSADVRPGDFFGPAGRDQTRGTPRLVKLPPEAADPATGESLWQASEQYTGIKFEVG